MPRTVSDTSVLHYLSVCGQFDLLRKQFSQVLIPPAVLAEVGAVAELPANNAVKEAMVAGWNGDVAQLRPLLDTLMTRYRFRLSRNLYQRLIAGE